MPFVQGQSRPMGAGRKRGTPNKDTSELARIVDEMEFSPFEALAGFAQGMVVELELMTLEEYNAPPVLDEIGRVIQPSGRVRALEIINPELRATCLVKMCEFLYPKRKAIEISGSIEQKVPDVPIPGSRPELIEHG